MAKHWMKEAFANAHGQLHKETGTPKGKTIPVSKLKEAVKKGGVSAQRARLVLNADHPLAD